MNKSSPPCVLTISGHDPTGGAGIQADIETIVHHRCHPCSVITALTAQDSKNVAQVFPQRPEHFQCQLDTLLADISFQAIKIGMLGSAEIASMVADRLSSLPEVPIVLDPVLKAGGGTNLANDKLLETLINHLLPLTTILTPNLQEARRLVNSDQIEQCAQTLLTKGCQSILITSGDEETLQVENIFYDEENCQTYTWERLPEGAHGSGCTLASAIAALLARGMKLQQAVEQAQQYTWETLRHSFRPGHGQLFPRRGL